MVYKLLRNGDIRLDDKKTTADCRVSMGQTLTVFLSEDFDQPRTAANPADLPAGLPGFVDMILFRNDDLLIVNKPRGLLTHGKDGLDEAALAFLSEIKAGSLAFSPAPLHRLDRNTSGVVTISASIRGAQEFSRALSSGSIRKEYLAFVEGCVDAEQRWEDRLIRDEAAKKSAVAPSGDGEFAAASVQPLLTNSRHSLIRVRLETGRTHQIRVQCAAHGHPLRGDRKYGGAHTADGYILHASDLSFPEDFPISVPRCVHAPLPEESLRALMQEFGEIALKKAVSLLDYPGST